jgi:hypothetical protein
MSEKMVWTVDREVLKSRVVSLIARISSSENICACLVEAPRQYDDVRNCIKPLFDEYDDLYADKYIGVLEWSFVKEVMDGERSLFPSCLDPGRIIMRLAEHPNINLV